MENRFLLASEYGRVKVCLRGIMEQRGLSRAQVARMVNTNFSVIDRLYAGTSSRVEFDILARLCYVLQCSLTDLLHYEAGESRKAPEE